MKRAIMKVRPQGLVKDLAAIDVAGTRYTDAANMVVRDGYQVRIEGLADVFGVPVESPVWLLPVQTATVSYWLYATERAGVDGLGVTDGAVHNDITPAAGIDTNAVANAWTGGLLNGVPFINAGGSEPVSWALAPGSPATILPGWPATAKCHAMRAHRNYLFALHYTDEFGAVFPQLLKWSDSAAAGSLPTTWVPAANNDAGSLQLAETPGDVIDGLTLRQSFIVYLQSAAFTVDFIGGQFVFAQRLLFASTGALSRNCVVEFKGNHAVLTDGDFVVHDGNRVTSAIDQVNRRFLFDNLSADNFERAYLAHHKSRSEIWICYPTGDNVLPNQALVWSYEDNLFGVRELYGTPHAANGIMPAGAAGAQDWDSDAEAWDLDTTAWDQTNFNPSADSLVLADIGSRFYQVDIGSQFVDVDINASLARDSLDLGDAQLVKTVSRIWPRIDGVAGDTVNVQLGVQMDQADPILFSAAVPFVIGTDTSVDTFGTGRLISVRLSSSGGQSWRTSGFDVEFGSVSAQ